MTDDPHTPATESLTPQHRLLRDLDAMGRLEANHRPPVSERLATSLGDPLLQILYTVLTSSDFGEISIPGRVA